MRLSKHKKFCKLGRGITLEIIRERIREIKRKKEFIARLQKGDRWNKTDDPGPY